MATIQRRGPKQWRAMVRRRDYPHEGKTFPSRAEAEAWARDVESKMDRGVFVSMAEAESTTLADALDRYEREVTPRKKGAKQEKYRLAIWRRDKLARRSLAGIRSSDLATWRDEGLEAGYSASKVRNDLALLGHLFNVAAVEWGMEGLRNPVHNIRKPALPQGRDRRLKKGEQDKLLDACRASRSAWLTPIVVLAMETGMRLGEIVGLRWENVDFGSRVASLPVTKNGTRREVPLSSRAVETLWNLPRSIDGQVFPIIDEAVKRAWRAATTRAGIEDLRFHDLRHEATSRLFEKGLDTMEVAAVTGHKTLTMLRRYTHLKAADLAKKLG